jgi:hypothetical protein
MAEVKPITQHSPAYATPVGGAPVLLDSKAQDAAREQVVATLSRLAAEFPVGAEETSAKTITPQQLAALLAETMTAVLSQCSDMIGIQAQDMNNQRVMGDANIKVMQQKLQELQQQLDDYASKQKESETTSLLMKIFGGIVSAFAVIFGGPFVATFAVALLALQHSGGMEKIMGALDKVLTDAGYSGASKTALMCFFIILPILVLGGTAALADSVASVGSIAGAVANAASLSTKALVAVQCFSIALGGVTAAMTIWNGAVQVQMGKLTKSSGEKLADLNQAKMVAENMQTNMQRIARSDKAINDEYAVAVEMARRSSESSRTAANVLLQNV